MHLGMRMKQHRAGLLDPPPPPPLTLWLCRTALASQLLHIWWGEHNEWPRNKEGAYALTANGQFPINTAEVDDVPPAKRGSAWVQDFTGLNPPIAKAVPVNTLPYMRRECCARGLRVASKSLLPAAYLAAAHCLRLNTAASQDRH